MCGYLLAVFRRSREWVRSLGVSWVLLTGMLFTGLTTALTAWLAHPAFSGACTVVSGLVTFVLTKRHARSVEAAAAARAQDERWAAAVVVPNRTANVPDDSVAALLHPHAERVPYNALHIQQLNALRRWVLSDTVVLHFLTGEAMVGKTRTARQLAKMLLAQGGWLTGFARPGKELDALAVAIAAARPALLIIDEDSPREALAEVLAELTQATTQSRVRVLVVARNVNIWQKRLTAHRGNAVSELVRTARLTELEFPSSGPHDHQQQFARAATAFALRRRMETPSDRLGLVNPSAPVGAVHAVALLAVLEAETSSTRLRDRPCPFDSAVFAQLLTHEGRYWRLRWQERRLEPLPDNVYEQVVAVALLLGRSAESLRRVPALSDMSSERLAHIAEWLDELSPATAGLFTSVLVTTALSESPQLARNVLTDVPVDLLGHVLSVLGHASHQLPSARPLLKRVITGLPQKQLGIALDIACEIGDPLDHDLAVVIAGAGLGDEHMDALGQVLVTDLDAPWCAAALIRERLRVASSVRLRAELLSRLLALLRWVGEYDEGILHGKALIRLLRRLARSGEARHVSTLATALTQQVAILNDAGRNHVAIGLSNEALDLARGLADQDAKHLLFLCERLNNHSVVLNALGKPDKALPFAIEAVDIGRSRNREGLPCPYLAEALNTLTTVRLALDHPEEAVDSANTSVAMFQVLAATNHGRVDDLARALTNLGAVSLHLYHHEMAVRVLEDAASHWRLTVLHRPHLTHGLIDTLINLGSAYFGMDRPYLALPPWQEALPLAQRLAENDRRFTRQYLIVRSGLGFALSQTGNLGIGLKLLRETIDLGVRSAADDRLCLPVIARAHDYLGHALRLADRNAEAITIVRDGIVWWRNSRQPNRQHLKALVTSLYNLGELLTLTRDDRQARDAYTEALQHARELETSGSCAGAHLGMDRVVTLLRQRIRGGTGHPDRFPGDGTLSPERLSLATPTPSRW